MTPIATAVEPLRSAAVERARKEASDLVARTFAKHAEDPAYHDYPKNIWGKREYAEQKGRYLLLQSLTTADYRNGSNNLNGYTMVRSDEKVARFIDDCGDQASMQYSAFIAKLEHKVGPHSTAVLTGSHVWGYSMLTVTLADGTVENWKTQQIINVSVLGKLFNQWPTRKIKVTAAKPVAWHLQDD